MLVCRIPQQLTEWRFILLQPKRKIPLGEMKGWAANRTQLTFSHNDPKLIQHIQSGGNYGVVADVDRVIIAADTKEVEQAVEARLPKTFTVRSPRHKTKHFYFYGRVSKPIQTKPTAQGDPCADIRIGNSYVLGPGSIFDSYGVYEVADDVPIATVTEEQIIAALDEFIIPKKDVKDFDESSYNKNKDLDFPIIKVLPNLEAMTQNGDELTGPHPKHGSSTGANFRINTSKNVWHCFRAGHESGGGPLELLAVMEGIIECADCHKGALRGKQFIDTLQVAKERGLIEIIPPAPNQEKDGEESEAPKMEEILEKLNSQYIFKTPTDTEDIYYYVTSEGIYKEAEHKLKAQLETWLGAKGSTHLIDEVLNHIKRSSFVDRSIFNKQERVIPVKNGLLNLVTLKLEPFDAEKVFTYKLDAEYDPTKRCPKFLTFISQVLDAEDIPTLQEYMGYCLVPAMPYHKMLWLYGVGRNGKGRITATLRALFGQERCAAINLEDLNGNNRFAVAKLYGKLINEASEPATNKMLQTPLLKKIIGEDLIDGEIKNKQRPIQFINFAKFFILGNRFPKVNDNTTGFWDRVLLIKFPTAFIGNAQVANIERTWTQDPEEMSGILNWMIEGLQRLLGNNEFTISKSTKETMLEFKRVSDTVLAFLDEQTEPDRMQYYTRTDFYELYKEYCDFYGLMIEDEKAFVGKIKTQPKIKNQQKRIDGKMQRVWIGVKVKPITTEEETDTTTVTTLNDHPQITLDTLPTEAHEAHEAHNYNSKKSTDIIPENKNNKTRASAASSASHQDSPITTNRFCGYDCGNFEKVSCPLFFNRISKDNPLPLKCYGYKPPEPTQNEEGF